MTTSVGDGADDAHAVALQSDGRIVAVGSAASTAVSSHDFALVRYMANGALDPSFGGDGKVTTNFDAHSDAGGSVLRHP